MDVSSILESLNEQQREAVSAASEHTLVLAGAGSGKTRVLVHRVAWLVKSQNVSPFAVLAVTFTNKAATEMRGRIEALLGMPTGGMWVGTFHGLAHRLLRAHYREADLPETFQILDSQDQLRLVKRVLNALSLDEGQWPPRQVQGFINARKNEGQRPQHLEDRGDPYLHQMIRAYRRYEELCAQAGVVDFCELLLRCHEMLRDRDDVLTHYRGRFRYILVDEFQDTNTIQYAWLRLLGGTTASMFVVGDDDQSIYGWRGARIENIHQFGRDFPRSTLIRLEQNYRSTATILTAANALISKNPSRLGKNLWTSGQEGELICLYQAFNDLDEARYVVDSIQDWVRRGNRRSEAAILYRSNAQSRVFEERLINAGVPYRVYGGLRFFERAEIKDALAYLRLIQNRHDDASFERVVNVPARGLGVRTMESLRDYAHQHGGSLWQAANQLCGQGLSGRASHALQCFIELIEQLDRDVVQLDLHEKVDHVIRNSGLADHYRKEKGERGQARIENLDELVTAARQYTFEEERDATPDHLSEFLTHAALEAGEGEGESWDDCVQLMTLHAAKGLEFELVFLCGLEEGLFPHQLSLDESGRLEEERRLCYVGMTRARHQLYLTFAERRRLHGRERYARPSRFIGEIPENLLQEVRSRPHVSRPVSITSTSLAQESSGTFRLGQRVHHPKFGEGVILNHEGRGSQARVQVNFPNIGSKWLVTAYANLHPV